MGRNDKLTVEYFTHNCNHGKTLFIIENRFANDGYAVWFKTLELLGSSENHYYDCRSTTDWEYLSAKMMVEPDKLKLIYNLLSSLNAIDSELWKHQIIRSEKFIKKLDDVYSRRISNCMNKDDLCKHLSIKCEQKTTVSKKDVDKKPHTKPNITKLNNTINIEFKTFWNKYDKKINKDECEKLWNGTKKTKQGHIINDEIRTLIMERLPAYVKNTNKNDVYPGRMHPHTYLYGERWNDEIVELNIPKKREIIEYEYECVSCAKTYRFKNKGYHRCTKNSCQMIFKEDNSKHGYALDFIAPIFKEDKK